MDFTDSALRHRRRAGHNEMLGRAVGWRAHRAPVVLDATAGFGRDAFVLADLGCRVHLCERHPVMALLLEEALGEASGADDWLSGVVCRMRLHPHDARTLALECLDEVEVIYLDPMFPVERKALPTKTMQVLHALLAIDDAEELVDQRLLVEWALEQGVARVVVKRPRRAPPLAHRRPSYELAGKAARFDVYVLRDLREDGQ